MKFVTKSGSNNWTGTAYEYLRHDALNANTWFNNRDLPPDPATGKAPKAYAAQLPAGHRAGRPDHQEQGVLLLQLRRAARAGVEHAAARRADAGRGERHLQLQHRRRRARQVNLLQLAAAQRPARDAGSDRRPKCYADIRAAMATAGTIAPLSNPLVQPVHVPDADAELQPVADVPPRLRADAESPADRVDELPPHQLDAGHDQQRAAAVPGLRGRPAASSRRAGRPPSRCARPSAATSSTRSRFGGTGGATLFSPEIARVDVQRHG